MTLALTALFYDLVSYDTIVRNRRWFDDTGGPSAVRNIGIRDGHVVAISPGTSTTKIARGSSVFIDGKATEIVGKQCAGRFLRAAQMTPAVTAQEGELASVG